MDLDIAPLLEGFDYRDGELTARVVVGLDGRDKVQIRIQCGMVQFEADGHPTGDRPFDHESRLAYHRSRIESVRALSGSDAGFSLSPADCAALREEAMLYYARYVACQRLREYARALRDTERNLEVMDLCARYAETPDDRAALEPYRPYVVLMRARARAGQLIEAGELVEAVEVMARATSETRSLVEDADAVDGDAMELPASVADLFEGMVPAGAHASPLSSLLALHRELEEAVQREDYRRAAALRDEILRFEQSGGEPPLPDPQSGSDPA